MLPVGVWERLEAEEEDGAVCDLEWGADAWRLNSDGRGETRLDLELELVELEPAVYVEEIEDIATRNKNPGVTLRDTRTDSDCFVT